MNLKIALAQCNFIVGDLQGNLAKIAEYYERAVKDGADLVVFSEMAVTGYPVEDLAHRLYFVANSMDMLNDFVATTAGKKTAILLGSLGWEETLGADGFNNYSVFNVALLIENGKITHLQAKCKLPNYSVFDETRTFKPGELPKPIKFRNYKIGIMVCEDMWHLDVAKSLKKSDLLICINASPFTPQKPNERVYQADLVRDIVHHSPLIYVNQVGVQDDIVFDGGSFVIGSDKGILASLPFFEEAYQLVDLNSNIEYSFKHFQQTELELIYHAIKLSISDYVRKNGFNKVLVGLSGGIDSALVATLAVDALGRENVKAIMMPSEFTSEQSIKDANEQAKILEIEIETIPIKESYEKLYKDLGLAEDITLTHENLQSRIRGIMLMARSNESGALVLTTGNKSEYATGYATLYGDMCGAYAPLKDVYKTEVYELANWRNKKSKVILETIIKKIPTAELKPGQKDQDTLPPYEILDKILRKLIEDDYPPPVITNDDFSEELVLKVTSMLYKSEYKRRQAPPGPKVSTRAFGKDRRYPITNKYHE